jgi:hypothetical protein
MVRSGGQLKAGKLTAGAMPSAGALSGGKVTGGDLKKALHKHLHPHLERDFEGAGLFDKLASIVNIGNIKRLYGAVDKGIKIGTKAYSAYGDFKKAYDGTRKPAAKPIDNSIQQAQPMGFANATRAPTATGAGLKKKRTLPPALKKRAERLGQLMKQGYSMKAASDMYKQEMSK